MTLRAATDYVRTFAEAFRAERVPTFGHLALSRSALEAAVVASWLNDLKVDPLGRINRGLCELLYAAHEVNGLRIVDGATERLQEWKAVGEKFGWTTTFDRAGRPTVGGLKWPSIPMGIGQLLAGDGGARLGRLLWSKLSAASHVTWFGIEGALFAPADESRASEFITAGVGTDSTSVRQQAVCLLRSLRRTATVRMILMGWNDADWEAACRPAEKHELALLRSLRAGRA